MNVNLVLFEKNGSPRAFPLPQTVTIIGRQQTCDLCVPLTVVSRKHCEINQDQGVLRVRDLGSRNGTFVNGKKVAEAVLKPGDRLQVGSVSFTVQIDGQPAAIAPSDSDIGRAPAHLGDTAKGGEQEDILDVEAVETMHHDKAAGDDDDDESEIFDDLLDGLQGGDAAS